jgi:DtxR family transcriptional regulator, manganese transport regulator
LASTAKLCSLGYNLTLPRKYGVRFGAGTRGADWRPDRYQITRYQIAWYQITMAKLPAEGTQARRFGKTRSAQSTALLEDYAELIADLLAGEGEARPTDIARRFGVSHATAIKTISRLKRAGLATARPYRGVFLTEKGHALADRVRVRHRLVVDLLRALGVPTEAAEADAEGIEHHVSEITLKAFAQFLKMRE